MSNSVIIEYEERVAAILNETGHPMRKDVMEDLRSHLRELVDREKAPRTMLELEERLGSPEEYAETLAPATGHRKKPLLRRRIFWVGAVTAMGLIATTLYVKKHRHAIVAHYREAIDQNFYATPFFDLERMRQLKVGASAEDIRDAIGYPFRRYQLAGNNYQPIKDKVYWEYTRLPSRYAPFYTSARLVTDSEEMRLLRLDILEHVEIGNSPEGRVVSPPVSVQVKRIAFARPDGHQLVLTKSSDDVYVIAFGMGVASKDDLSEQAIREREELIAASWKNVPFESIGFIHIAGPKDGMQWPELNRLLNDLPKDSSVYSSFAMPHEFDNRGSPPDALVYDIQIYCRGVLYHYPEQFSSLDPKIGEANREDGNWLMHRLLE